jgi:cyclopropane fatty-acyl-phospholipid synthase-like methyltransferase
VEKLAYDGSEYLFDRTEGDEERRLAAQARLFDPLTERLLREAGIIAGMRVLELGSAAGDARCSLLASSDGRAPSWAMTRPPEAVGVSRRRAEEAGLDNVRLSQQGSCSPRSYR